VTNEEIIADIVDNHETGEYTDDPADAGGPTRWGVTILDLSEWLGRAATPDDVRALTRETAIRILTHKYLMGTRFLEIRDDDLRAFCVDWAVLHGVAGATRKLQGLVGATVDGKCGPKTLALVNAADPVELLKNCVHTRMTSLIRIALSQVPPSTVRTTNLKFLAGWWNRVWDVGVKPL